MYGCKILSASSNMIIVESPDRFQKRYMRESAIGLTGQVVIYFNDRHNRRRQTAHGSRFTVKFVEPPKKKSVPKKRLEVSEPQQSNS